MAIDNPPPPAISSLSRVSGVRPCRFSSPLPTEPSRTGDCRTLGFSARTGGSGPCRTMSPSKEGEYRTSFQVLVRHAALNPSSTRPFCLFLTDTFCHATHRRLTGRIKFNASSLGDPVGSFDIESESPRRRHSSPVRFDHTRTVVFVPRAEEGVLLHRRAGPNMRYAMQPPGPPPLSRLSPRRCRPS